MRAVQVLATYFGDRRTYPHNCEGVCSVLDKQIGVLRNLDLGYSTDLIIVNHDNLDPLAHEYLRALDGTLLKNGRVRILHRPILNQDMSFGSYKYAYFKFKDEYDYWFFNEDDILPQVPGIMRTMIGRMEDDGQVGFVAALKFTDCVHVFEFDDNGYIIKTGGHAPHAHGGVGLTSTTILQAVASSNPEYLETPNIIYDLGIGDEYLQAGGYGAESIEIDFTNAFVRAGYALVCSSTGKDFLRLQDGRLL